MKFNITRRTTFATALWAVFLCLLFVLFAVAIAPQAAKAGEPPHALVVLLERSDDPGVEIWRLLTDVEAPVGSETGPTTSINCAVEAMTRIATWLHGHMPGWELKEWRCLPVGDVEGFLERHRGAAI